MPNEIPTFDQLRRDLLSEAAAQIALSPELAAPTVSVKDYAALAAAAEKAIRGKRVAVDLGTAAAEAASLASLFSKLKLCEVRSFTRADGVPGVVVVAEADDARMGRVIDVAVMLGAPKGKYEPARLLCWGWRLSMEGTKVSVRSDLTMLLAPVARETLAAYEDHPGLFPAQLVAMWQEGLDTFRPPWGELSRHDPHVAPPAAARAPEAAPDKPAGGISGLLGKILRGFEE